MQDSDKREAKAPKFPKCSFTSVGSFIGCLKGILGIATVIQSVLYVIVSEMCIRRHT